MEVSEVYVPLHPYEWLDERVGKKLRPPEEYAEYLAVERAVSVHVELPIEQRFRRASVQHLQAVWEEEPAVTVVNAELQETV